MLSIPGTWLVIFSAMPPEPCKLLFEVKKNPLYYRLVPEIIHLCNILFFVISEYFMIGS